MQPANKTTISIHPSTLKPKFANIGYGNPRYNSMVVCPDDSVLISCGATMRRVDLVKNQVLYNKQIGWSQIFQIMENERWIMVINFDGLISLLYKETLEVEKQFYAGGKQIRHSSISKQYIAVCLELNNGTQQAKLQIYSVKDILSTQGIEIQVKPIYQKQGYYYYPQIVGNQLMIIQFHDPNPKGRSRTETVMNKKLPIKHKLLRKSIEKLQEELIEVYNISTEGEILCAAQNCHTKQIFYLHEGKKITILWLNNGNYKCQQICITATASPYCIQSFKEGVLFCSKTHQITYLQYQQQLKETNIQLKTKGLMTSYCLKQAKTNPNNFIFFNENGLQYYDFATHTMHSQNLFDITNCGISLNKDGTQFAVADFGGNIYTFSTSMINMAPVPITKVCVCMPIRTLVWCHDTDRIIVGCVGGFLYSWDGLEQQANLICQTNDHTINILRYFNNFIIFGTSDGYVHIMSSQTLQQLYRFQAHIPIHYQNEKDRELFGSMKNYAQIWSIITYPTSKQNAFNLVTCSQDQTQKVFLIQIIGTGSFSHSQLHHLVGHSLAVTSIDWKSMKKGIGTLYVSCSDDKIVRFRNPQNMFQVIHELQTSTIKQWHTLTYLALEPDGYRVAIGSQNGYLFIFNIQTKQLLYGQKIHLGGVQGMDWNKGVLVTCSSDLCISIINL